MAHPQLPLILLLLVLSADVMVDVMVAGAEERRSPLGDDMARAYKQLSAPSARIRHALASLGNALYLFGGKRAVTGAGAELLSDLWRFENGAWTRLEISGAGSQPQPRCEHQLIARQRAGASGKILVIGGVSEQSIDRGCCKPDVKYLTDMWAYDVAENMWQMVGDGPAVLNWGFQCSDDPEPECSQHGPPIAKLNMVAAGEDLILASFGHRPPGPHTGWKVAQELWYLNTSSANLSSWVWREYVLSPDNEQKPPARYYHSMAWVDAIPFEGEQEQGILVVFGGTTDSGPGSTYFDDTWLLSVSKRNWYRIPSSQQTGPPARAHHNMAAYGRFVYLHGGTDSTKSYNDVWRFDVKNQAWSQINLPASTLVNRCEFAMTTASGLIYLHGGALELYSETDAGKYLDNSLWRVDVSLLCDISSFYLKSADDGDKGCQPCSTCDLGFYEVSTCYGDADRGCLPCSKCGKTQFQDAACSSRNDAICSECADLYCAQSEVETSANSEETGSPSDEPSGALVITSRFREGCGLGEKGSCKECSRCKASEYLLTPCSAEHDVICQECSILEAAECNVSRMGYQGQPGQNVTSISSSLSGCGWGNRGKCITVSVAEVGRQAEPLWLVIVMIAAIAILTLTLCGVALHLKRWVQKKKQKMQSQHHLNTVQQFAGAEMTDLREEEVGDSTALQDLESQAAKDTTQDLEEGTNGGFKLAGAAGVGLDHQLPRTATARKVRTHSRDHSNGTLSTPNKTPGSESGSNELLSLQSRPIPPADGFTVGGRRQRTKDPVIEHVHTASRSVSPFDAGSTASNGEGEKVDLEISPGLPPPATITPTIARMANNVEANAVSLSPEVTKALDDAAETRKKLARERGRRKAETRMKQLAASSGSPSSPLLDEDGQVDERKTGAHEPLPCLDDGQDGRGQGPSRDTQIRTGPQGLLPPLRGARAVRSALESSGDHGKNSSPQDRMDF